MQSAGLLGRVLLEDSMKVLDILFFVCAVRYTAECTRRICVGDDPIATEAGREDRLFALRCLSA